jgi:hypothetical protein
MMCLNDISIIRSLGISRLVESLIVELQDASCYATPYNAVRFLKTPSMPFVQRNCHLQLLKFIQLILFVR